MFGWRSKEKPLRQELIDARSNLQRELENLQAGAQTNVPLAPDNRSLIATLEAELRDIDEALATLGPDDT
jgi:hypothetical protein